MNQVLIHSKKTGGKGRCSDPNEIAAVFAKVREQLEKMGVTIPEPLPEPKQGGMCSIA